MANISADSKIHDEKLETGTEPVSEYSSGETLHTVDKGYGADTVISHLSKKEEQRILRKVDYRLVPILALLYLVAFVDRSNIGMLVSLDGPSWKSNDR